MTNLYQSDVKLLSDEELKTLSEELYDEYTHTVYGDCGCCSDTDWDDDVAEKRYYEIREEIRVRWRITHPGSSELGNALLSARMMSEMVAQALSRNLNTDIARMGAVGQKIGDTVTIKRPTRFFNWRSGTMVEKEAQSVETDNERTQGSPSE